MKLFTYLLIFLFIISSCYKVTPECEYENPVVVYCQVTNWVDQDSTVYNWTNGFPLEIITFDGNWTMTHHFFWSDQIKPVEILDGGRLYWGAHWVNGQHPDSATIITEIRFYETSDLENEITALRTGIIPQWIYNESITSYEDKKDMELCYEIY